MIIGHTRKNNTNIFGKYFQITQINYSIMSVNQSAMKTPQLCTNLYVQTPLFISLNSLLSTLPKLVNPTTCVAHYIVVVTEFMALPSYSLYGPPFEQPLLRMICDLAFSTLSNYNIYITYTRIVLADL